MLGLLQLLLKPKTIANTPSTLNIYLSVIFLPSKNWCSEHNTCSSVTIATSVARQVFTYYAEEHVRNTTPCIPTFTLKYVFDVLRVFAIFLFQLELFCCNCSQYVLLQLVLCYDGSNYRIQCCKVKTRTTLFSADTQYVKKKSCCCIYYNFNAYFFT